MKLAIAVSLSYSLQQNYLFRSCVFFFTPYFKDRTLTGVSIHATSEFRTAFIMMIIFEVPKRSFLYNHVINTSFYENFAVNSTVIKGL
jgi:hypothetical protein